MAQDIELRWSRPRPVFDWEGKPTDKVKTEWRTVWLDAVAFKGKSQALISTEIAAHAPGPKWSTADAESALRTIVVRLAG